MNLILYHHNSFGGTYDYSIHLFEAYSRSGLIDKTELILPSNAAYKGKNVHHFLMSDMVNSKNKYIRKFHYVYRTFINPLRLWLYILNKKNTVVIFNEFEQLTSIFWIPLFKLTKKKSHVYAVVLHDPDRDNFLPNKKLAARMMKWVMEIMDIGFYHEVLPQKWYYQNPKIKYVSVSLGIYPKHNLDQIFFEGLISKKEGKFKYISILGNIKYEKNYHLMIPLLAKYPELILMVAGRAANSNVDTGIFKKLAAQHEVSERIIWIEEYLGDEQLAAVIEASDIILLNYSRTFKSQSSVLFLVSSYKKPLIVSEGESALAILVRRFKLGVLVEPDSMESLNEGLHKILKDEVLASQANWEGFFEFGSWHTHVKTAVNAYLETGKF